MNIGSTFAEDFSASMRPRLSSRRRSWRNIKRDLDIGDREICINSYLDSGFLSVQTIQIYVTQFFLYLFFIHFATLRKIREYITNMLDISNSFYMLKVFCNGGKDFFHTKFFGFFDSFSQKMWCLESSGERYFSEPYNITKDTIRL